MKNEQEHVRRIHAMQHEVSELLQRYGFKGAFMWSGYVDGKHAANTTIDRVMGSQEILSTLAGLNVGLHRLITKVAGTSGLDPEVLEDMVQEASEGGREMPGTAQAARVDAPPEVPE